MNIQREMTQRVTNGLSDLRNEMAAAGVVVEFTVKEIGAALSVAYREMVVGGVVEPGQMYIVGDDGPETFEATTDESDTVILESKSKKAR